MAQRCTDRRKKILRYPHRNECRGHSRAACCRRYRNKRESIELSRGFAKRGNIAAFGNWERVVARGTVRSFAKIARPGISRPAGEFGSRQFNPSAVSRTIILGAGKESRGRGKWRLRRCDG